MPYYQVNERVMVEAYPYHEGLEDGFTKVDPSKCFGCQDTCKGCLNYRPYINTTHGKSFIHTSDYIAYDYSGRRYVFARSLFEQIFET